MFWSGLFLVTWATFGVATAQTACEQPNVAVIVVASVFGTLAVVLVVAGVICFILWKRRRDILRPDQTPTKKLTAETGQPSSPDYVYNNPGFSGDKEGADLVAVEEGASGYVPCREFTTSEKKAPKTNVAPKDSTKKTWASLPKQVDFHGSGLVRNGSLGSLDDNFPSLDPEVVSVWLQSQDFIGLGFNIAGSMRDGIYVSQVHNRGPAIESGKFKVGDRILSVTISFENMVYEDALTILSYASPYPVKVSLQKEKFSQKDRRLSDSNSHLNHPLYRSQSVDTLARIGKEPLFKPKRTFSEMRSSDKAESPEQKKKLSESAPGPSTLQETENGDKPPLSPFSFPEFPELSMKSDSDTKAKNEITPEVTVHIDADDNVFGSMTDGNVNGESQGFIVAAHGQEVDLKDLDGLPSATVELHDETDGTVTLEQKTEFQDCESVPNVQEAPKTEVSERSKAALEFAELFDKLNDEDKMDVLRLSYEDPNASQNDSLILAANVGQVESTPKPKQMKLAEQGEISVSVENKTPPVKPRRRKHQGSASNSSMSSSDDPGSPRSPRSSYLIQSEDKLVEEVITPIQASSALLSYSAPPGGAEITEEVIAPKKSQREISITSQMELEKLETDEAGNTTRDMSSASLTDLSQTLINYTLNDSDNTLVRSPSPDGDPVQEEEIAPVAAMRASAEPPLPPTSVGMVDEIITPVKAQFIQSEYSDSPEASELEEIITPENKQKDISEISLNSEISFENLAKDNSTNAAKDTSSVSIAELSQTLLNYGQNREVAPARAPSPESGDPVEEEEIAPVVVAPASAEPPLPPSAIKVEGETVTPLKASYVHTQYTSPRVGDSHVTEDLITSETKQREFPIASNIEFETADEDSFQTSTKDTSSASISDLSEVLANFGLARSDRILEEAPSVEGDPVEEEELAPVVATEASAEPPPPDSVTIEEELVATKVAASQALYSEPPGSSMAEVEEEVITPRNKQQEISVSSGIEFEAVEGDNSVNLTKDTSSASIADLGQSLIDFGETLSAKTRVSSSSSDVTPIEEEEITPVLSLEASAEPPLPKGDNSMKVLVDIEQSANDEGLFILPDTIIDSSGSRTVGGYVEQEGGDSDSSSEEELKQKDSPVVDFNLNIESGKDPFSMKPFDTQSFPSWKTKESEGGVTYDISMVELNAIESDIKIKSKNKELRQPTGGVAFEIRDDVVTGVPRTIDRTHGNVLRTGSYDTQLSSQGGDGAGIHKSRSTSLKQEMKKSSSDTSTNPLEWSGTRLVRSGSFSEIPQDNSITDWTENEQLKSDKEALIEKHLLEEDYIEPDSESGHGRVVLTKHSVFNARDNLANLSDMSDSNKSESSGNSTPPADYTTNGQDDGLGISPESSPVKSPTISLSDTGSRRIITAEIKHADLNPNVSTKYEGHGTYTVTVNTSADDEADC